VGTFTQMHGYPDDQKFPPFLIDDAVLGIRSRGKRDLTFPRLSLLVRQGRGEREWHPLVLATVAHKSKETEARIPHQTAFASHWEKGKDAKERILLICRNCLVFPGELIKLCDLAAGSSAFADHYAVVRGRTSAAPIRWQAWETILLVRAIEYVLFGSTNPLLPSGAHLVCQRCVVFGRAPLGSDEPLPRTPSGRPRRRGGGAQRGEDLLRRRRTGNGSFRPHRRLCTTHSQSKPHLPPSLVAAQPSLPFFPTGALRFCLGQECCLEESVAQLLGARRGRSSRGGGSGRRLAGRTRRAHLKRVLWNCRISMNLFTVACLIFKAMIE